MNLIEEAKRLDGLDSKIIYVEVSTKNEGTDSPWWILIDPNTIKEIISGTAEHGEVPDSDYLLRAIAGSIVGPFFSREDGENYLKSRSYEYSEEAAVWCASGYWSKKYKQAYSANNLKALIEMIENQRQVISSFTLTEENTAKLDQMDREQLKMLILHGNIIAKEALAFTEQRMGR